MLINEITVKKGKQVKANSKKPKLVKPSTGHESPHPLKGKLVGEADEPKVDKSARAKLDHSLRAQGHKVEKDRKKEMKKGVVKHKGMPMGEASVDEAKGDIRKGLGALAIAASLYGVGSLTPSAEETPLGKELAAAAKAGDEVAAYHLDSLDLYVDENMQRTLVNLRIAYLEDSPRQDVKAYLSDPKRFPGVSSEPSIRQQINWNK